MPPTTPPAVKTRFTNKVGDRVTVMTDGTKTRVPAVPQTDVPVAAIDSGTPKLSIPEITPPTITTPAVDPSLTPEALNAQTEAAQAVQAGAKVAEGEAAIRSANATLGTESAKRTELETKAGIPQAQDDLRRLSTGLAAATADLRQFDLDNVNTIENMRVGASRNDLTKRTFNAASAEAGVQMAVQRAGKVASIYTQQASIQVLQDNVKGATEAIDKALNSFYDPIRQELKMEEMFYQRNSQLFDSAQNRAADARLASIKQQRDEIDRAINLSDAAVSSGYASPADIEQMSALSGDPKAQADYARQVVARGAREEVALRNAAAARTAANADLQRRQLINELALAGDQAAIAELGYDPGAPVRDKAKAEADKILQNQIDSQNETIGRVEKMLAQTSAIDSVTGVIQNGFLTGLKGQTQTMKVGDQDIEVGTGTATLQGGLKGMQDKADFLGNINYILAGEGFKQFQKLSDMGVKLTPVSELEFNKVMQSASYLNSVAEIKDGQIVGFGNVSPDVVKAELKVMLNGMAKVRDEKAAIKSLGIETFIELQNLQAQPQ